MPGINKILSPYRARTYGNRPFWQPGLQTARLAVRRPARRKSLLCNDLGVVPNRPGWQSGDRAAPARHSGSQFGHAVTGCQNGSRHFGSLAGGP